MANNIFFQSFVGKDYADGGIFGKRIMVLGESHYCDEGCADCGDCRLHRECMGFTQGVLRDYLDEGTERQNWMRTFVKFERSLVGEETDQALRLKIWNSVVFFNYLQVAMEDLVRQERLHNTVRQVRLSSKCSTSISRNMSLPGATDSGTKCPVSTGRTATTS